MRNHLCVCDFQVIIIINNIARERERERERRDIFVYGNVNSISKRMSKSSDDDVVSDEELRMCVDVLERVWRSNSRATPIEGDFLLSKKCKSLRRAIGKFSEWNEKRKFAGAQSKEEYRSKQQAKKELRDKKLKEKALDRKHINNRKLRLARLQKLKKLQEQVPSDLPLIPDGFVCSEDDVKCIKDDDEEETTTKLYNLRSCYVCKARFRDLHKFYDQLCPSCADLNFQKRHATVCSPLIFVLQSSSHADWVK